MTEPTMADMQIAMMKRTKHPLAPLMIEELYSALDKCGRLLAGISSEDLCREIENKLLDALGTDEEKLEQMSYRPELCVVLMAMLSVSLKRLACDTVKGEMK